MEWKSKSTWTRALAHLDLGEVVLLVGVNAAQYSRLGFCCASPNVHLIDQLLVVVVPGNACSAQDRRRYMGESVSVGVGNGGGLASKQPLSSIHLILLHVARVAESECGSAARTVFLGLRVLIPLSTPAPSLRITDSRTEKQQEMEKKKNTGPTETPCRKKLQECDVRTPEHDRLVLVVASIKKKGPPSCLSLC